MMHSLLDSLPVATFGPLPIAEISPVQFYAVYLPMFGLLFGAIIAVFAIWTTVQNNKTRHETIRLALEKGQPIPPGLLDDDDKNTASAGRARRHRSDSGHNDLRGALVLFAVAGGLYFIVPWIAPMLAFIGVALLICWWVERRSAAKNDPKNAHDETGA